MERLNRIFSESDIVTLRKLQAKIPENTAMDCKSIGLPRQQMLDLLSHKSKLTLKGLIKIRHDPATNIPALEIDSDKVAQYQKYIDMIAPLPAPKSKGRPITTKDFPRINLRIPQHLYDELQQSADDNMRSLNSEITLRLMRKS